MTMNQTVLITGGTKRIGLAITQCLHKNGYNVIVSFNKFTFPELYELRS